MFIYLSTFLIALSVTLFATPFIQRSAVRIGAVDEPNERKIHSTAIPRLGGVGIFLGFSAALLVALVFAGFLGRGLEMKHMVGILISSLLMLALGVADDMRGLSAWTKLIAQIAIASVAVFFGIEITFVSNPFNGLFILGAIAAPLTVLWLVGMTNAINLIDGLDGLAAGVTAISSGTLFVVALRTHQIGAALVLLALCGASLGFLRYNFFPAKIFLGDSGSYLLGFILAAASVTGVFKTTLVVALIIPILILGVPIFDTMFAIGRRISSGQSPFKADNRHIHHLLLRAGFTQREAVLAIYVACFMLSITALVTALQR